MVRVKKHMLIHEADSKIMIKKYISRRKHEFYAGGCPQNYCSSALCDKYNGCNEGLDCDSCWSKFLDDIIIAKRNNMEVYYE